MSKETKAAAAPEPEVVAEIKQSLNEFCARLSVTVKRPELIGAFHHSERTNGHLEDTEAEFMARFSSFRNKPV